MNITNALKKESHYHNFELWGQLIFYLKEYGSMVMVMVIVEKGPEIPRISSICFGTHLIFI